MTQPIINPVVVVEKAVLSMLYKIGSQLRTELHATVPGMNKATITKLLERGLVRVYAADPERVFITGAGQRSIGIKPEVTKPARSPSRSARNPWLYDGAELRPYEGRPGAMDAFALPSRRADGLHYPDGKFKPEAA